MYPPVLQVPPFRRPGQPGHPALLGYPTAPELDAVSPASDRIGGGATITLTGKRFQSGATVQFGSTSVSATVVSPTEATVTAPAHVEEVVDITFTNPNGESDTLELAFSFIAGHIISLSQSRGPLTGGTELFINGINFLASSTITFGGVAATGVQFIDEDTYYCVTPAHASGLVDVVITEPSATTVTGSNLFGYTAKTFGGDRRRKPSLLIRESTGSGVNTASYTVDGLGVPPAGLEPTIFADNDGNTLFGGQVTSIEQSIEAKNPLNLVWKVGCVDHTLRFNKRRPFGIFNDVPADVVARVLVAQYAPGFTTTYIEPGLPNVSMILDGADDMWTVFQQRLAGPTGCQCYIDPDRGVHLYKPPILPRETVPPTPMGFGAAAMTVAESTVSTLGHDFKAGYYWFYSAFGYTSTKTYTTPHPSIPIPPWPGYVQLSDEAADLNLTGQIPNGEYGLGFSRGWVMYDGSGNLIPEGWTGHIPRVAGDVLFATEDVATVLENKTGFESRLSALAGPIYLADFLPEFDNIPIGPTIGSRDCTERIIYAARCGDEAILGSWSGLKVYYIVEDNTTTGPIAPVPTFEQSRRRPRYVVPPIAPNTLMTAFESDTDIDPAVLLNREAQEGYWAFKVTGVYEDGTQTRGSLATGPILLSGTKYARLTGMPIFPDIGSVSCVYRIVYASIFEPFDPLTEGVPTFSIGNTRRVALVLENTSTEAEFPFGVSLIGGEQNPPNLPPVRNTFVVNTLEGALTPDTIDDNDTQILVDPSPVLRIDYTQIRNRILVFGKSTVVAKDAAKGATRLWVSDVSSFSPTGGRLQVGHRILNYRALLGASSGTPKIVLTEPLSEPIKQADWLFGGGTPVRPLLIVEDIESQTFLSLIEIDEHGLPTDGVHEFTVNNNDLATQEQMHEAGMGELLKAWPRREVRYSTRDPEHRKGRIAEFDLTHPPISGFFFIDDVSIDQYYDISLTLQPRYNVTASTSQRYTLHQLLRAVAPSGVAAKAEASLAGVVDAAVARVQAEGGLKRATVSVTTEQMRTLFSSPIEVIAAGPTVFIVKAVVREVVTTGFDDDTFLQLAYAGDTATPFMLLFGPASINQTPYAERYHLFYDNEDTVGFTNSGIVLQSEMDVTGGEGELELTVYYVEVDA